MWTTLDLPVVGLVQHQTGLPEVVVDVDALVAVDTLDVVEDAVLDDVNEDVLVLVSVEVDDAVPVLEEVVVLVLVDVVV